ncbi:hypothetical protein GFY24_29520 [Nocardia sp. SYP-A9097]|uniref:hypothetical protein n=1 Tax=Nocardia sp. SYP-A9097 TaxID=2663237 RepID=UPI00129BAFB6|nr:hypothetical protein [Nocardia sp. SYP-A9097]MRH91532.1 hypothetical protein [Nocardia sp. SYP-A9097]
MTANMLPTFKYLTAQAGFASRPPDDPDRSGAGLIWEAMGVWELDDGFGDVTSHTIEHFGTPVLIGADALLNEGVVPSPLCIAVLDTLKANWS